MKFFGAWVCLAVAASAPLGIQSPARPSVSIPRVIAAEVPQYPRDAAAAGATATLELRVSTDGSRVTDAKLLGAGHPGPLVDAAVKNLKTWRFRPHIATIFNLTFKFTMVDRPCDKLGRNTHDAAVIRFPFSVEVFAERDPACPGATRPAPAFNIIVYSANVPMFPPAALAQGIDGRVTIGVTYKGVLSVAGGPEEIAEPVMNGVRDWMINPAPYSEELQFNFVLEDGPCAGGPDVTIGPGQTRFEIKDRRACARTP